MSMKKVFWAALFAALIIGVPIAARAAFSAREILKPPGIFLVYETKSEKVLSLSPADYLTGCLYAQIPVDYDMEALKAQAVASYTYALRVIRSGERNPKPEYRKKDDKGEEVSVYLSNDLSVCQGYYTREQAKAAWGADYEKYYKNVRGAAEYGAGKIIIYNDEPIYAVYHRTSNGQTNSAADVWGRDFPYLRGVDSSWDRDTPNFTRINEMTDEQVRSLLTAANPQMRVPLSPGEWFTDAVQNGAGYVSSIKLGENLLSGGDVWRTLGINSTCFSITHSDGVFAVSTRGIGHGVGLSQSGARYMAEKGYTAEEILAYYYPSTTLYG
ncbi:stage II sporulation protein D [Clostridia bacterium]|nr:stage II sporulation protein D [Clostridia bacterium]